MTDNARVSGYETQERAKGNLAAATKTLREADFSQEAARSISGGYHSALLTIVALARDVLALLDENEELTAQRDAFHARIEVVEAENDRLREALERIDREATDIYATANEIAREALGWPSKWAEGG